jgi:hypothetical protein
MDFKRKIVLVSSVLILQNTNGQFPPHRLYYTQLKIMARWTAIFFIYK